jgi:hypothetical protein
MRVTSMVIESWLFTFMICCASSRVGARISAWHSRTDVSSDCRMLMANVAVLPVPVYHDNRPTHPTRQPPFRRLISTRRHLINSMC